MNTIITPTDRLCCNGTAVHTRSCHAHTAQGRWTPQLGIYRNTVPTLAEARLEADRHPDGFNSEEMVRVVSGARAKALAEHDDDGLPACAFAELGGVIGTVFREVDAHAGTVTYTTEIHNFEARKAGMFLLTADEVRDLQEVSRRLCAELDAIEAGEWVVWE